MSSSTIQRASSKLRPKWRRSGSKPNSIISKSSSSTVSIATQEVRATSGTKELGTSLQRWMTKLVKKTEMRKKNKTEAQEFNTVEAMVAKMNLEEDSGALPNREAVPQSQVTQLPGLSSPTDARSDVDNARAQQDVLSTPDVTFAQRVQSLLTSLPTTCVPDFLPMKTPSSSAEETRLVSMLSSLSTMQESLMKGRDSIVTMFDNLRSNALDKGKSKEVVGTHGENQDMGPESSSIMISSPLLPTAETEVEIARSEIVSIDLEEGDNRAEDSSQSATAGAFHKEDGTRVWPFGRKGDKQKVKEFRVWYPSRTKVSLQAMWWGYRIYLPPPVMRILDDKSLEAAKRAAMLTAALTWLVSHIPSAMLPPQVRPIIAVANQVVPLFSYIGAFIAWSWNTVKGFDKGDGVILTATWILPIAIVPGTWSYTEPPPIHVEKGTDPITSS